MNNNKKKISDHKCLVNGCSTNRNSVSTGVSFFRFPKDDVRCKTWAAACACLNVFEEKGSLGLYSSHRVCGIHFEDIMFKNDLKNRLHSFAVPILHLGDEKVAMPGTTEITTKDQTQAVSSLERNCINSILDEQFVEQTLTDIKNLVPQEVIGAPPMKIVKKDAVPYLYFNGQTEDQTDLVSEKQTNSNSKEVVLPSDFDVKREDAVSIKEEPLSNFFQGLFESRYLFGLTEYWAIHSCEPSTPLIKRSTTELKEPRCVVFSQLSICRGVPMFEKQVTANDQLEIRYFFGDREYNLNLQETYTSLEELSQAINEFAKIKLCPGIADYKSQEEIESSHLKTCINEKGRHKDCEIFLTFEKQLCVYCQDFLKIVRGFSENLVKHENVSEDEGISR